MPVTSTPKRLAERRNLRLGAGREVVVRPALAEQPRLPPLRVGLAFPECAALDGDEARAEPLHAGVVLVAGRLVDPALASEFGLQRFHRQAVGLLAAVAAAFAHQFVDDDAPGRIREFVALAAAALLRGAGLHVDERRHALVLRAVRAARRRVPRACGWSRPAPSRASSGVLPFRRPRRRWAARLRRRAGARSSPDRAGRRGAVRRSSPPRRCRGSCRSC